MEPISYEQKLAFASENFPGQKTCLENQDWWWIQVGTLMKDYLHYEYNGGRVHLHIEGSNWRPLRNYLRQELHDERVVPKHWWRQDCCWTLDTTPQNWEEVKSAFKELDRIMRPHILRFERMQNVGHAESADEKDYNVQACKVTISQLLGEKGLNIPDYQRPYCWTAKNVEQLLNDIKESRQQGRLDYLIGSVILHKKDGKTNGGDDMGELDIVDGQQRVTTICLIARLVCRETTLPSLTYNHTESYFHIRENATVIKRWLNDNIGSSQQSRTDFLDYLLENCRVVQITVAKLNEAFQLFETQNGRGKALEAYNLLKAYHIRAMADEPQEVKRDCDVRWEDAALFDGNDLLKQVIDEHLYRIRIWSRNKNAYKFTKKNVDEFKGFTIGRDSTVDYAYQNTMLQQQIALGFMRCIEKGLFKIKSRFKHGDPVNISPFASINQLIINGKSFFDYIETYTEIYKRLFMQPDSSQLFSFKEYYESYCKYSGSNRKGDGYIRKVYKSAIMLMFDRFGESGVNEFYKDIYLCLYRYRLEKQRIWFDTMCKADVSGWLFATIQNAKNISELMEIKSHAEEARLAVKANKAIFNGATKVLEAFVNEYGKE